MIKLMTVPPVVGGQPTHAEMPRPAHGASASPAALSAGMPSREDSPVAVTQSGRRRSWRAGRCMPGITDATCAVPMIKL
jgi:hypothetical protein